MTVAIHQPNYLPWLGYFYKIYASDVFVFHDAVAFSKASYTKRCKIRNAKGSAETTWLSLPVKQHHTGTLITDILLSHDKDWLAHHLQKIRNTYASAQHFADNYAWLTSVFDEIKQQDKLSEFNASLIRAIVLRLGFEVRFVNSSDLTAKGKANALNLAIVRELGGSQYMAGTGSQNYQDDAPFIDAGIQPIRHDIGKWLNANGYQQGTGQFTGGLSIIDSLMHIGVQGIRELFLEFTNARDGSTE